MMSKHFRMAERKMSSRRQFTPAMACEIDEVFTEVDAGGKGWLTRQDLKIGMMTLLGYKPARYAIDKLLPRDAPEPTDVDRVRFSMIMEDYLCQQDPNEDTRQMFLAFDVSCTGFITESDLMKVVTQVAPSLSESAVVDMFREGDRDGDGRISYRDFDRLMMLAMHPTSSSSSSSSNQH